jgi:hypothetical protein
MSQESQEFFQNNKFVVVKDFINKEVASLLYYYCKTKSASIDFKKASSISSYDSNWDGRFNDSQAPGAYSYYGDPVMDSVMMLSLNAMMDTIGLDLIPNYSYWRLYQKDNVLDRHRDRPSCEISATICLGYDVSNVDNTKYPNYVWPMFVETTTNQELPIALMPGDLIIYRGCEINHWREKFIGLNHAQVFIHFNDAAGPFKNVLDNRHIIGIPKPYEEKR